MSEEKILTKGERIKKEILRLNRVFKNLTKDTKTVVDGLIKESAYMRIQLEDFKKDLDDNGWNELFTQSSNTPPYERERPTARQYINVNRLYQNIIKQLNDLLPKGDKKVVVVEDGYNKFVQGKPIRR